MKVKATPQSGVVVELDGRQPAFPQVLPMADFSLRRILVPVDFSPLSRKALDYAIAFARQFNAEILLFHAVALTPPPFPMAGSVSYESELRATAESELAKWRDSAGARPTVKTRIQSGDAPREIINLAKEDAIDLIIIGTHSRSGVARFLLGSTTERVVRDAPCPVMVVREKEQDFVDPNLATAKNAPAISQPKSKIIA
jgi:universal stress protein A